MDKTENWKPVLNYEGLYEVSDLGRVKSIGYVKKTILKTEEIKGGYLRVQLSKDKKRKHYLVHRLVYEAFNSKQINDGVEIDHIDANPCNNSLSNLRCVTPKENSNNPITKARNIDAMKKLWQDQEFRKRNAEAVKKGMKKLWQNQEFRKNQSDGVRKKWQDIEWRNKMAKSNQNRFSKEVGQYDLKGNLIKLWSSSMEIQRTLGYSFGNICSCCRGKRKQAYGFIWKYKEEVA